MPGMFQLREFHSYKDLFIDLLVCDIVQSCNLLRMFQGTASILYPEDRGSIFFRESDNKLFVYVVSPFSE